MLGAIPSDRSSLCFFLWGRGKFVVQTLYALLPVMLTDMLVGK